MRHTIGTSCPVSHVVTLAALVVGVLFILVGCPESPSGDRGIESTSSSEGSERFFLPVASEPIDWEGQSGRSIEGLRIDAEPSIVLRRCRDITIVSCDLRGVQLVDCENVQVVNSWIHDGTEPGVVVDEGRGILVQGNRIERVASGLYAHRATGVRFIGNSVRDVRGPMPRGQMAQFDKVTGPGNEIARNFAVNHMGQSSPEDAISIFKSTGTSDEPILIADNVILGDPVHGSEGMSDSGSGIMLGDSGGAWIVCRGNIVVSPGQVGIGVAGGSDIIVEGNDIRGRQSDVSNVGLSVWNQSGRPGGTVTVRDNRSSWINAKGEPNPWWDGGGFDRLILEGNAFDKQPSLPGDAVSESVTLDATSHLPPEPFGESPRFPWESP